MENSVKPQFNKHAGIYARLIFLFVISSSILACEHEAQLTYKIKDETSAPLKIVSTSTRGIAKADTFVVGVNEEVTIAVNGQGLNRVNKYKEKGEMLRDFSRMDILKNSKVLSKTNFLITERWTYKEKNAYTADYLLTVTDADF